VSNRRALPVLPGRSALATVAAGASAALVALLLSVPAAAAGLAALLMLAALLVLATLDYVSSRRAWRHGQPRMTRRLPAAFAIGVRRPVELAVEVDGSARWTCELYDYADAALTTDGLPVRFEVRGGRRVTTGYVALPTHRWEITFAPADIRVRSRWGFCDLLEQIGTTDTRRVYPDFAQVARYAWLAGDRARRDDGGRRAGTPRHRAGQPLQRDQARRPDLTRDIYTCARD